MSLGRPLSFAALGLLVLIVTIEGCDGSESTTGPSCALGSERCACYGNKTCDEGLVCRSKICVDASVSDAGGGGQDSTSSAGTSATGQGGAGNSAGISAGAQGGDTLVGAGGTTLVGTAGSTALGEGGTTLVGAGGTTTLGQGGTTLVGTGGTTTLSEGGTTLVGTGGTTAIGSGGTGVGGTMQNAAGAGQNLIKNGDFSLDGAYWHVKSTTTNVSLSTSSIMEGTFCITASTSYTSQLIGWPVLSADAAKLTPGATYALSFRARATYSAYLAVKVAAAVTPWLPTLTTVASSAVSTTWQQYRTTFVAQGTTTYPLLATTPIGLAITVSSFTNGLVCVDDVVLAEVL